MRSSDIAILRRSRLLSGFRQPALAALLTPCFVQALPADTVVCVQGEKAQFLHMVVSGRVGLFGEAMHGEALVEIFGPGDAFILPAVTLEAPYLVSARLLEAGRILM